MDDHRAVQHRRVDEWVGSVPRYRMGTVSTLLDRGEALVDRVRHGDPAAAHSIGEPHASHCGGYTLAAGDFSELRVQLLVHAVGGLLVLLTITALSVYKPWGRIGSAAEPRAGKVTAI